MGLPSRVPRRRGRGGWLFLELERSRSRRPAFAEVSSSRCASHVSQQKQAKVTAVVVKRNESFTWIEPPSVQFHEARLLQPFFFFW
ncbi:hypothetical protein OPV22_007601 [Ensete ventricosum]|uniref:Uncharacterized protein n=1 Tax=Ensete ventricosum TaxID=4639 RepID=A0AAV8RUX5_ENSVE|nr:hypothetical protein OPV22_007601 [Ensete ventricosum]